MGAIFSFRLSGRKLFNVKLLELSHGSSLFPYKSPFERFVKMKHLKLGPGGCLFSLDAGFKPWQQTILGSFSCILEMHAGCYMEVCFFVSHFRSTNPPWNSRGNVGHLHFVKCTRSSKQILAYKNQRPPCLTYGSLQNGKSKTTRKHIIPELTG